MFLEILFFGFVQGCTWYKICSLVCLQAEKEETVRETFLLLFLFVEQKEDFIKRQEEERSKLTNFKKEVHEKLTAPLPFFNSNGLFYIT